MNLSTDESHDSGGLRLRPKAKKANTSSKLGSEVLANAKFGIEQSVWVDMYGESSGIATVLANHLSMNLPVQTQSVYWVGFSNTKRERIVEEDVMHSSNALSEGARMMRTAVARPATAQLDCSGLDSEVDRANPAAFAAEDDDDGNKKPPGRLYKIGQVVLYKNILTAKIAKLGVYGETGWCYDISPLLDRVPILDVAERFLGPMGTTGSNVQASLRMHPYYGEY
ncbi:hypothetical protein MPSEU_000768700 [Mayamaea pseudoterrestris]|nr:hypothetical protein MPSEU_000768700 [Mayamaea pseudoterrestris]